MDSEIIFYKKAKQWLDRLFELDPVAATYAGDHHWDDRLADLTVEGLESQHHEMRASLAAFQAMETDEFRLDAEIDHRLIVQLLKSHLRQYERIQQHRRDPGYYLDHLMTGIFLLVMRQFAPLRDRLGSALGRVQEVPRVLEEARANLVPQEVPPVWAQIALEQAGQAPGLFVALLPSTAGKAAPDLESGLKQSGQAAARAIRDYQGFLEREVLPKAEGDFAAGPQLFDEMLRENHMVDYDARELLETGWRLFRETQEQMETVAGGIDPRRSVEELLEEAKSDHPQAQDLLKAYQKAMDAARQYVIDHNVVTIPEGEVLRIVETPEYLRPVLPYAAYMPPGVLEEEQEGLFLVTPVEAGASAEAQEQKLKGHNYAKLPITALHEAYPGHHLQLVWANRHETIPRRMGSFLSTFFIEGWAFYCEELMEQLGYIAEPVQKLGRLTDQLWRAGRIILDVSLHTKGMTVDEAVNFLVEKCRLEPANALAEVRRYTTAPTQPQSYLMGKLAILDLVDQYKRAKPRVSLREMHDAILSCGSLPPKLMRERLLSV